MKTIFKIHNKEDLARQKQRQITQQETGDFLRVDPLNARAQQIIEKKKHSIEQAKKHLEIKERYRMNKGDEESEQIILGDREIPQASLDNHNLDERLAQIEIAKVS